MKRLNTNLRAGILSVVLAMCGLVATAQVNVTQSFVNGTFPGEVGWEVIDPGNNVVYCFPAGGGIPPAVSNLNLAPGVYSVQAYDSFGDGWNGATVSYAIGATPVGGPFGLASGGFSNVCSGFPNGGSVIGSFTVALACTLTCPDDIAVDNTPGTCGAIVDYEVDLGDCTEPVTYEPNYPPGSEFPVGETVVTVTSGIAQCEFTVTVNDIEAPTLTCPSTETISLDPG